MRNLIQKWKKVNPAARALFLFVVLLLGLSFLFAPQPKPVDYRQVSFATSADARLYFHNVRSFYYAVDSRSKTPMVIYRLKRRNAAEESSSLQFAIVQHPHTDEAFPFVELGNTLKQYPHLAVHFSKYGVTKPLSKLNAQEHYAIAALTYSSFLAESAVLLLDQTDTIGPLYRDKELRRNASVTLDDYFTLIGKN